MKPVKVIIAMASKLHLRRSDSKKQNDNTEADG